MVKHVFKILLAGVAIAFSFGCPMMSFGTAAAHATEQPSDQQFKAKEDQALAAERNHEKYAANLWNQIANSEIGAGLIHDGLKHERHAMQLYSSESVGERSGPLAYLGSSIIYGLTQQGHPEEAEKLLKEAVTRAATVTGSKSIVTQAQIGDLFVFYVHQKNYKAALKSLVRMLDFDLSRGETPSQALKHSAPNVIHRLQPNSSVEVLHLILGTIQEIEKSEPLFAITAVEKVLKAQEACLTVDDERLVETLGTLGDAYYQTKKYNDANRCYSRAYQITKQYHPESAFTVHQCGQNFLANLREVGRFEEADRLSKLDW